MKIPMNYAMDRARVCEYMLHSLKIRVLLIILLGSIIGLGVPAMLDLYYWDKSTHIRPDCQLPPAFRLDSLPNLESSSEQKKTCESLKSCWDETVGKKEAPNCYHPHPSKYFYEVTLRTDCNADHQTHTHLSASAVGPNLPFNSKRSPRVQMTIVETSDHLVSVRFFDEEHQTGFEPTRFLNYDLHSKDQERCNRKDRLYDISHLPDVGRQLFADVKRRDGLSLFNTNFGPLIFANQYIELTTVLPSNNFYGLGQGRHTTFRHNLTTKLTWTLFAGHDEGWGHGVHPFYLCLENDGRAHGVLLEHTNAMEITTQDVPAITYRTTGSSLTFHILMGPTPADVMRQLTELVGRPALPPYWALGHHVCRSGASAKANTPMDSIKHIKQKRIPQESDCWSDSLAMGVSEDESDRLKAFADELRKNRQKLILVQVPHVLEYLYRNDSENRYVRTKDKKTNIKGKLSKQWVLYPNYFKEDIMQWHKEKLEDFINSSTVTFDGYLLTNNTPVDQRELSRVCTKNIFNAPEFLPGKKALWNKTMCLDACFEWYLNEPCNRLDAQNHYNLHNLYGFKHMEITAKALKKMEESNGGGKKRPFLASMSTFMGSGKFGGHFSVGSNSTWEDIKVALVQSLEFNLYGIPLVGAPICGYNFKKEANIRDLCTRWAQLASFQPLVLSYHNLEADSTITPVTTDEIVSSVTAAALQLRYTLLPYLYTLFYEASISGAPVMRPLFYEFPDDPAVRPIDEQFMWGSGIMISPVLTNATTHFKAYFPKGTWYDFYDGGLTVQSEKGEFKNLTAIEYHINIHLRGGYIVARQEPGILTEYVRNSTYKIRVALDRTKDDKEISATGLLYIDDGITIDGPALLVNMTAYTKNLTFIPTFINGGDETSFNNDMSLQLDVIHILGLKRISKYECKVDNVVVDNCNEKQEQSTLTISKLTIDLTKNTTVTWDERKTDRY